MFTPYLLRSRPTSKRPAHYAQKVLRTYSTPDIQPYPHVLRLGIKSSLVFVDDNNNNILGPPDPKSHFFDHLRFAFLFVLWSLWG